MKSYLLKVPPSKVRKGDLVTDGEAGPFARELRKVARTERGHWPGDPATPATLVTWEAGGGGGGQWYVEAAQVFVVRRG